MEICLGRAAKIAEYKDPQLTSSHEHTKIIGICKTTFVEEV